MPLLGCLPPSTDKETEDREWEAEPRAWALTAQAIREQHLPGKPGSLERWRDPAIKLSAGCGLPANCHFPKGLCLLVAALLSRAVAVAEETGAGVWPVFVLAGSSQSLPPPRVPKGRG